MNHLRVVRSASAFGPIGGGGVSSSHSNSFSETQNFNQGYNTGIVNPLLGGYGGYGGLGGIGNLGSLGGLGGLGNLGSLGALGYSGGIGLGGGLGGVQQGGSIGSSSSSSSSVSQSMQGKFIVINHNYLFILVELFRKFYTWNILKTIFFRRWNWSSRRWFSWMKKQVDYSIFFFNFQQLQFHLYLFLKVIIHIIFSNIVSEI